MTEDLKKPQPDDVTGHMLLEYSREDYLDSGMEPGERGAPISIGEAERAVEMYFFDYEELIAKFLLRRVERLIQQDISLYRNSKTDIVERWARGMFEGDSDKVAKAREQVADWNAKNPDRQMQIKLSQLQRRVNEMRKLSSERIIKAAPKDIRGNVSTVLQNAE